MKITTFNVNSLRARMPHVIQFLQEEDVDVLLLQETKVEDAAFPAEPLEDLGYNVVFHGQKSYNGVAIVSKHPLEEVTRGLTHADDNAPILKDARYIEAFAGGVWVASVYVPNGEAVGHAKYQAKEIFFKALANHLKPHLERQDAFVLGGDFNVAPTDHDVYDPKKWSNRILCSDKEREWYRSVLFLGLEDPLDTATGDATNAFTWWDYRTRGFDQDNGLRIDHLLLSPQAADLFVKGHVSRNIRALERPSDHAPVTVTLSQP